MESRVAAKSVARPRRSNGKKQFSKVLFDIAYALQLDQQGQVGNVQMKNDVSAAHVKNDGVTRPRRIPARENTKTTDACLQGSYPRWTLSSIVPANPHGLTSLKKKL